MNKAQPTDGQNRITLDLDLCRGVVECVKRCQQALVQVLYFEEIPRKEKSKPMRFNVALSDGFCYFRAAFCHEAARKIHDNHLSKYDVILITKYLVSQLTSQGTTLVMITDYERRISGVKKIIGKPVYISDYKNAKCNNPFGLNSVLYEELFQDPKPNDITNELYSQFTKNAPMEISVTFTASSPKTPLKNIGSQSDENSTRKKVVVKKKSAMLDSAASSTRVTPGKFSVPKSSIARSKTPRKDEDSQDITVYGSVFNAGISHSEVMNVEVKQEDKSLRDRSNKEDTISVEETASPVRRRSPPTRSTTGEKSTKPPSAEKNPESTEMEIESINDVTFCGPGKSNEKENTTGEKSVQILDAEDIDIAERFSFRKASTIRVSEANTVNPTANIFLASLFQLGDTPAPSPDKAIQIEDDDVFVIEKTPDKDKTSSHQNQKLMGKDTTRGKSSLLQKELQHINSSARTSQLTKEAEQDKALFKQQNDFMSYIKHKQTQEKKTVQEKSQKDQKTDVGVTLKDKPIHQQVHDVLQVRKPEPMFIETKRQITPPRPIGEKSGKETPPKAIFKLFPVQNQNQQQDAAIPTFKNMLERKGSGDNALNKQKPEEQYLMLPPREHTQSSKVSPPTNGSLTLSPSESQTTIPIKALSYLSTNWTIKARVILKSPVTEITTRAGKLVSLFSIDLLDKHGGEIEAIFYGNLHRKYSDFIKEKGVYLFSGGLIKSGTDSNEIQIVFEGTADIKEVHDDGSIPKDLFRFVTIPEIDKLAVGAVIDVIGIVYLYGDEEEITGRNGEKIKKRKILLYDNSRQIIEISMWGKSCLIYLAKDAMVIFKNLKVNQYLGKKCLVSSMRTAVITREFPMYLGAVEQVSKLRDRADVKFEVDRKNFTRKTIEEIFAFQLTCKKDEKYYFDITATIMHIQSDILSTFYYLSCPREHCLKKVIEVSPNQWKCVTCQEMVSYPKARYTLSILLSDFTASVWANAFDVIGEHILDSPASNMRRMRESTKEEDQVNFQKIMKAPLSREYRMRVMIKFEEYKGKEEWKWSILKVNPVNYLDEARVSLQSLQSFKME